MWLWTRSTVPVLKQRGLLSSACTGTSFCRRRVNTGHCCELPSSCTHHKAVSSNLLTNHPGAALLLPLLQRNLPLQVFLWLLSTARSRTLLHLTYNYCLVDCLAHGFEHH